ncbi:uncharacterized protein LOC5500372 [Nematostella vectensis]|uniref:uncharacterized protein LOC5500372 n=1 Tax=Nematostella vectensis TaxID=45351 RepID=UPI002077709F|nr:uncharacterized protein LOC5500372 [Nematostella vectensis]
MQALLVVCIFFLLADKAATRSSRKKYFLPHDDVGTRRADPQIVAGAAEIATEQTNKIIDKGLERVDEQQKRAEDFLKQKISLDIRPDVGWKNDDMFAPPGLHYGIGLSSDDDGNKAEGKASEKIDPPPYSYANGFVGPALMNGCFGSGYQPGDPCYTAKETTNQCRNMIDGAAFIGVGFDGKGEFSPESRKMSIIQRSCGGHSYYDDDQVPDTMNVHGIYDTSAHMYTFSSRSEYQSFLQKEAGVSGSFLFFYGGVKKAWGTSESSNTQQYLSIFDIDVTRYEIFKDEVKPSDLSQSFLKEFLDLPESYSNSNEARAFQDFILRWGTHYVKSAKFGGQLEFRKTLQGTSIASKEEASVVMEAEYKGLFTSGGVKYSSKEGKTEKSENKYSASSIVVQGGSHEIAAVIADEGTPLFKNELKEWLASIPKYPKAYKFHLGSITELVNFRAGELFPEKYSGKGCDRAALSMELDKKCKFKSRKALEIKIRKTRKSLERAVEIYLSENPNLSNEIVIGPGSPSCELGLGGPTEVKTHPTWVQLKETTNIAEVEFDMRKPLYGKHATIAKDMKRRIKFRNNKWFTSDETGKFVLYNAYPEKTSDNKKIITILGVELVYNEGTGFLTLNDAYFEGENKPYNIKLKDIPVALVTWPRSGKQERPSGKREMVERDELRQILWPCNVEWLNENMVKRSREGECIHFAAASAGPIYVVFSLNPSNKDTWYHLRIGQENVAIFKKGLHKVGTTHKSALGLGDPFLFQPYFVCIKEGEGSTVIEYGKSHGRDHKGDVYLSLVDTENPIDASYYAFGNGEKSLQVSNVHVVKGRASIQTKCRGVTLSPEENSPYCVNKPCHRLCDPLMGCSSQDDPSQCGRCRHAKIGNTCVERCTVEGQEPKGEDKLCIGLFACGMKNKVIPDGVISASTMWDNRHRPQRSRLDTVADSRGTGAWSSRVNDKNQWLQIAFGGITKITGIITQGRQDYDQWVTEYKVEYSENESDFTSYDGGKILTGNTDRNTKVQHIFRPTISARFIRVRPVTWQGHISMRMELLCNE